MERLMEIKKILEQNRDLYYIETVNRETGWVGCASFYTNGEAKIYVNEGDGSGKDDAGYTYEEFLQKYDYDLMQEYAEYEEIKEEL